MRAGLPLARRLGALAARAFAEEHGYRPRLAPDGLGDWDQSAWDHDWREILASGACDDSHEDCLGAWQEAFWAAARPELTN